MPLAHLSWVHDIITNSTMNFLRMTLVELSYTQTLIMIFSRLPAHLDQQGVSVTR